MSCVLSRCIVRCVVIVLFMCRVYVAVLFRVCEVFGFRCIGVVCVYVFLFHVLMLCLFPLSVFIALGVCVCVVSLCSWLVVVSVLACLMCVFLFVYVLDVCVAVLLSVVLFVCSLLFLHVSLLAMCQC